MTTFNDSPSAALQREIAACRLCAPNMPHPPRPVVQTGTTARIVIIGQAPGARVQESGIPWNDASGERLREWTGIPGETFYDASKVVLMPMGFCYPGAGKSGDLPPRPECAPLWHDRVLALLPSDRLLLLVGSYAQARYLTGPKRSMTENVREQPCLSTSLFALPHPSWRSAIWMRRNPWFETETLPVLRSEIRRWLATASQVEIDQPRKF